MSSSNILNVGHTEEEIEAAILFALGNEEFRKNAQGPIIHMVTEEHAIRYTNK